jgi:Protein of unknown function (DUF4242)
MDLPISITSAVAATRRQDFTAQADADRAARLARDAGRQRRSHFLARVAAAVTHRHLTRGLAMPRFMDFHEDLKLQRQALEQITIATQQRVTDEYGVRQIELYHNTDGNVYCLLEAPDEDAIRQHHHAFGVPCGDVHQVASLIPESS